MSRITDERVSNLMLSIKLLITEMRGHHLQNFAWRTVIFKFKSRILKTLKPGRNTWWGSKVYLNILIEIHAPSKSNLNFKFGHSILNIGLWNTEINTQNFRPRHRRDRSCVINAGLSQGCDLVDMMYAKLQVSSWFVESVNVQLFRPANSRVSPVQENEQLQIRVKHRFLGSKTIQISRNP